LGPIDALWSLDRAAIHPGAGGKVPHLEGVIELNDVGIALGCINRQLRFCCHLALKGDAQTRSTLDALLALGAFCSSKALLALNSLDAIGAGRTSWAIHTLQTLNALWSLEGAGSRPSHGSAGKQPGVISAAIADQAPPFGVSTYLLM
jgi:hypothetical protein